MNRRSWQDELPHEPRFGRRGRAWFHRRLRQWATSILTKAGGQGATCEQLADAAADWYTARVEHYVEWQDEEQYRGARFADGCWVIRWRQVEQDSSRVFRIAAGEPDPTVPPPAVPPGPVDVEAALAALTSPCHWRGQTREPRAGELLDEEGQRRLQRSRAQVNRRRTCECCGQEFNTSQRYQVTCNECKAAGLRKCMTCGEVFHRPHPRARQCSQCVSARRPGCESA